jgi:SIR2-like protein
MAIDQASIDENDWNDLLRLIRMKKCTPFIGAGASYPYLPLGGELAYDWSNRYKYPLTKDMGDLAKVAQFMSISRYPMFPREIFLEDYAERVKKKGQPDFSRKEDPHGILADLDLPIYITTNYDHFMFDALKIRSHKKKVEKTPKIEVCRWSNEVEQILKLKRIKPTLSGEDKPTPNEPLIYYLHGHLETPESMLMTENDYLDFIIRLNEKEIRILPHQITTALATNALLFVGYSLADWNFRVLFRSIFSSISSFTSLIIAVQLRPRDVNSEANAMEYLSKYFGSVLGKNIRVRVYWGESTDFAKELRKRWEA